MKEGIITHSKKYFAERYGIVYFFGKKTRYFKHRKYQNLWMNNKITGDEKRNLFAFSSKSVENLIILISQGSVATCQR